MSEQRGLYGKFIIEKANGEPLDPEAQYFVLNYAQDPHARAALRAYAKSVQSENPDLARDLRIEVLEHSTRRDVR